MQGFRHCVAVGQKVGLRLTLTRHTAENLDQLFDFIEREGIDRACFYHLCPAGRGKDSGGADAGEVAGGGRHDHHADGGPDCSAASGSRSSPSITTATGRTCTCGCCAREHPRAQQVLDMLKWNGGGRYSSGVGIANIDFNGNVHADQFSMFRSFGNVKQRKFSEIWQDTTDPIMAGLKDRLPLLKGRCGTCRFKSDLRRRAAGAGGDHDRRSLGGGSRVLSDG